ncbi:hypothetical protein MMC19_005759 [Ptychographa xylographoides]|nr:hypothetical protein [Ptychographa xylographoides]
MVTSREGLSIAELIFYIPALPVAVFVAFRHGFGRQAGWFFLIILALIRIIGSICEIVSVTSPSQGVIECAVILSSVGLSPMILAMLGLLKRVHEGINDHSTIPKILNFIGLLPIAALIMAIIGGIDESSSKPSEVSTGTTLVKAAIIIFLVVFLILAVATIATFFMMRSIAKGEERILYALALSIPFILVRLIYSLLVDFSGNAKFSLTYGDVVIQGCMAALMEFIVVIIYLGVGLITPKITRSDVRPAVGYGKPSLTPPGTDYGHEMNYNTQQQPAEQQYQRTSRRSRRRQGPIHMLFSYISTKL